MNATSKFCPAACPEPDSGSLTRGGAPSIMTEEQTLFEKWVDRSGDCHIWMGSKNTQKYGQFCFKKKYYKAHRVAYRLAFGPIPEGLLCCHHCDNPSCVNPAHLFLGTAQDNSDDKMSKGRGGIPSKTKLCAQDVVNIRADILRGGVSQKAIAERYEVSQVTISAIKTGRRHSRSWIAIHHLNRTTP